MKYFLIFLFAILCLACKNNKNKVAASITDSTGIKATESPDLQQETDKLAQLTPYTTQQMQEILPLALDGDSTDTVTVVSNMGTNATKAIYQFGETSSVEVNVFDCAGSAGAGLYTQFMNQFNNPDNGFDSKPINFKGNKALELIQSNNNASLTYFAGDRWLVVLDGKNAGIEKLKEMAGDIKLK